MQNKKSRYKSISRLNERNHPITHIEHLSNELFLEIFDYLEGCDIHHSFFHLNSRFQQLLTCPTLLYKIQLPTNIISNIELCYKTFVIPHQHHILSLRIENLTLINNFIKYCIPNSSFDSLQSITLGELLVERIPVILSFLKSLPNLLSLTIRCGRRWYIYFHDLYRTIFSLPRLRSYEISLCKYRWNYDPDYDTKISLSIVEDERVSTVEYLVIRYACSLDELISILRHTPRLRHLTCESLSQCYTILFSEQIPTLIHLESMRINNCSVSFDDFEMFLKKTSPQLRKLIVRHNVVEASPNDDRWKTLIKTVLLHLRTFSFNELVYSARSTAM
ncbi:unnamed protein product [Adineta ricciae]|uniref:F-box domain-containing protein n=1 Tax=Adineta ricciae TaxID=249248 RepID=A0A814D2K6_ADIRI|nr:unnamed protein product [Adineta ricciae]